MNSELINAALAAMEAEWKNGSPSPDLGLLPNADRVLIRPEYRADIRRALVAALRVVEAETVRVAVDYFSIGSDAIGEPDKLAMRDAVQTIMDAPAVPEVKP